MIMSLWCIICESETKTIRIESQAQLTGFVKYQWFVKDLSGNFAKIQ